VKLRKKILTIELKNNQSALILNSDEHCEISVTIASGDHNGLTATICGAIAEK